MLKPLSAAKWNFGAAAHLLNRAGFGGTPAEIEKMKQMVEQAMLIPGGQRMRRWQTKLVLREALRPLVPEAVLTRPKMGFPVPFGSWMRGAYRSTLDEYVLSPRALDRKLFSPETVRRIVNEHLTGARSHGDRLWLLVNLELWLRMAIDGEEPQPLERWMDRMAVSV